MDKRPMGYIPGKGNPLDKKPPPSKKYQNVKSKLAGKTGATVKDVQLMSDQHVAKRKGELFGRIKPSSVITLLKMETNQESIYNIQSDHPEEEKVENVYVTQNQDQQSVYSFVTAQTNATQVSQITQATEQLGINDDTTYLILDLRENDDFNKFHINEAVNFPAPNISRDKFIPQLYRFKNQENKMIIVYHTDERNGVQHVQLLAQKGYDNVFLLTGGIESFMQEFPEYIEGNQIPNIPQLKDGERKKKLIKRSSHVDNPTKQGLQFKKDYKGDTMAKQIIENQQSVNLSQANQSDITSVQGGLNMQKGIKNPRLTKQNLDRLGQK